MFFEHGGEYGLFESADGEANFFVSEVFDGLDGGVFEDDE